MLDPLASVSGLFERLEGRGWRAHSVFFFQAEDGIRDGTVTGVQTCALPISAQLLAQIEALREGGGIVVTGPHKSGRSTLLRRIAWSLGVERAVAWVEAGAVRSVKEALEIELAGIDADGRGAGSAVVLIDDADRLAEDEIAELERVREDGAKLVFVTSAEQPSLKLPGPTFEIFPITPLDPEVAGDLVRRTIPSLSDAVVAHVVARAEGWPGRIRVIVTRLEGAPVVAPADVDRLL